MRLPADDVITTRSSIRIYEIKGGKLINMCLALRFRNIILYYCHENNFRIPTTGPPSGPIYIN